MTLRDYQVDAIIRANSALNRSGSVVLQMPTGAGKTKTATEMVAAHDGIVWFICHRREIVRQAANAFRDRGIDFGVISPVKNEETGKKYAFDPSKGVQIISIGSLAAKRELLPNPSLVVWDECHHLAANTWSVIRESLPDAKHLGLTATPERLDGTGLRNWFAELVCGPPIPELVPDYLSPYIYFAPSSPDLTAARLRAGDYCTEDAAKAMNAPVIIGDAIREYKDKAAGKRAIAFCVTTEASRALVERFNLEGIPAVHVDAKTKDDARLNAVNDLAAGRIKVLSNVEVFTEGVDIPEVDAAILMRPTKSPTMFLQMLGRVLRKSPGKNRAIILDHAGLIDDHGKLSDPWKWSIDGGAALHRRKSSTGFRKCPKCKYCPDEREPVCSNCGHKYETGREIGVYDGVLRQVDGVVPDGCETVNSFAKRHGFYFDKVAILTDAGLPMNGRFVRANDADLWLLDNDNTTGLFKGVDDGVNASISAFGRRHGVTTKVVRMWLGKGLPHFKGRYTVVPIKEGDDWVLDHSELLGQPARRKARTDNVETLTEFGLRYSVSLAVVKRWRSRGMPCSGSSVEISAATAWVMENVNVSEHHRRTQYLTRTGDDQHLTMVAFAKRYGFSKGGVVKRWIDLGLPTYNGLVKVDEADIWVAGNEEIVSKSRSRSVGARSPSGSHEGSSSFARRLFISPGGVDYWRRKGLPYHTELGIPIREGLEWVRDNRPDIKIPPESWPSDNDNEATIKAA